MRALVFHIELTITRKSCGNWFYLMIKSEQRKSSLEAQLGKKKTQLYIFHVVPSSQVNFFLKYFFDSLCLSLSLYIYTCVCTYIHTYIYVASWLGRCPEKRKWHPTPGFLHGKSHGQKSLVGALQSLVSQRV